MNLSYTYRFSVQLRKVLFIFIVLVFVSPTISASTEAAGPVIVSVNINSCVGSITISVTDGVGPYTYLWRDSGGNDLGVNFFFIDGLVPDDYTVTVTDANGDSVTATYTITNPPDLTGTVVVNDVTCKDGNDAQVIITMANGNPPYPWELFNDDNGNQVQTGTGAIPIITLGGLGVGNYRFEVEDINGCTGTIYFTITEPADYLQYNNANVTDATCFNSSDGEISIDVNGGWGVYSYRWIRVSDGVVVATNQDATGLAPGQYYLEITDANPSGNPCIITTTNYTVGSPPEIVPSAIISDALCNGDANGSINLSVSGGVSPYSYAWSNGATSQDISGLAAGSYTVTITDNSGCTDTETFTVGEPGILTINPNIRDVNCFGENTGRIRSNVTGGTEPYSYSWSTGNSGKNLNNRTAGTYSLTVTDANGCTATATGMVISEPLAALSKDSETLNSPSCFGGADGSITIYMTGGTAPYAYSWSNGDTGNTASGLSAGIYSLTVTDNAGCTYTENITLNNPTKIALNPSLSAPTCNGLADGSISVSPTNGTGPYTYNWSTGDSGASITGIPAGSYTVTVTDFGGCSVTETITLTEPSALLGNAIVNDISCSGANDGSIFLGVSGGTAPYTYLWNTGATSNNVSGLADGNYSVTITDNQGCSLVENYTISNPSPLTVSFSQIDLVCKGGSTGSIDITPAGGTAPYSYLWSNGATSEDVSNLTAGAYAVTIRDSENCNIILNVTLTEPATVLSLSGTKTNATCNGSDNGTIDLTVTGGSAPYTYSWSHGPTTEDVNSLSPGNYTVTVTDNNGCVKFMDFSIAEPSPLAANATVGNISCNGADDGSIQLNVTGGTAPYVYAWADDISEISDNRSGLAPGNYTVTITDNNGCIQVESYNITEPTALSASYSQANVSCFGESTGLVNLTISGGTAPYNFSWSNGEITEDINSLPAGAYSVTVTDNNGCTLTENVTITEPPSALSVTGTATQITCNGAADGIINVSVSGGTAPYSYNWSNGSISEDLNSLSAGTYNLTVTDNLGCTETVSYTITDPPLLVLTGTASDITCNGADDGMIDINLAGGEAPYTYAWSNGETTEDISNLAPGSYSVVVTDARGCTVNETYTISQPVALNLAYTFNDVDCFGNSTGAIDITITGGTTPYSYSWDNGSSTEDITGLAVGDYAVTVTDANGCMISETITISQPSAVLEANATASDISCFGGADGSVQLNPSGGTAPYTYSWNTGATTKDVFGLTIGNYQVTITDFNGCTITETYAIDMPPALQASGVDTDILCNGANDGAIDLTVIGGTTPYTFVWSNGENTEDISGLSAGNYQVTIIDASGCTLVRNFEITEPLALNLGNTINDVSCFGAGDGSIILNVSGGITPYTYAWSNGETTDDIFNLSGGSYSVTITDGNGCTTAQAFTVNEPLAALSASGVITDESCFGDNQGAIDLTISGGTAPYTTSWNQGSTTEDIAGLAQGVYQVNVTDANGCNVVVNFTIGGPDQISLAAALTNVSCNGNTDGAIDITPAGGSGPYTFAWSNAETTEDVTNLSPGSYAVTVTDSNGCSYSRAFSIQEPLALTVNHSISDVSCFGANDGNIVVNVSGGTAPYTYAWSNGATSQSISGIGGGSYTLIITDGNGCITTQSYTINEPSAALTAWAIVTNENCFGDNQGAIDLSISGGTMPYDISWNQGSTSEDIAGLSQGVYQVSITDANGCMIQADYTVSGPAQLEVSGVAEDVTCNGNADGSIDLSVAGGIAPYTYLWSNGETTEDLSSLVPGTYAVTITDSNACATTETYTISEPLTLAINHVKSDVTCFGSDNGSIDVTISGGNLPYSYAWSTGASTEDISNLSGGTYQLTVTDNKGCQVTKDITINAPIEALGASTTVIDVACFGQPGGQLQVTPTGGTGPYTYAWSNGSNQEDQVGLFAGDYALTITDAQGCQFAATYTVNEPIALDIQFDVSNTSCFGDTDGKILTTVTGGTAPYNFIWSNGSTSQDQINIRGGTYNLTVVDANGCTFTKAVVVGDSQDLNVQVKKRDVLCKGDASGLIELEVIGGSGVYSYAWDNGANTAILNDLAAGVYNVLITDAGGCATTASAIISEPAQALSASISGIDDIICFGDRSGLLQVDVEGGVGPYTYLWSNGERTSAIGGIGAGSYTVSVKDANECLVQVNWTISQPDSPISIETNGKLRLDCKGDNDGRMAVDITGGSGDYEILWSTGDTGERIENLEVGDYTIRVRDLKGCVEERVFTVTEPDELTIGNAFINESQCYNERNGSIELNVNGGTPPYTYQWSNNETTKNLIGITSGSYAVLVTDANGCQVQGNFNLSSPGLFDMNPVIEPISCIGAGDASIALNIQGGIEPVAIQWSTGASTETVTNLRAGQYNVLVTDNKGCTIQQVFNIVEPTELSLDAFIQNADECNNPESGRVNLIVSGGTKPYQYRWSNGATTSTIEDVLPGTYVVEVMDAFGCTMQGTYTVLQPEPLQIGLSSQPFIDCDNRIAGMKVLANVKGGLGNYSYNWSRGESNNGEILLTTPGRLTLEITDGRGCFQMNSIDIDIPELGEADYFYNALSLDEIGELAIKDPVSFFDESIGEVIDWQWDFGDGFQSNEIDPIHVFDAPGLYTVTLTITDRTGCTSTKTSVLDLTKGYKIIIPNAFTPNNDGNNDFFRPEMRGLTQVQLIIFNTWGEVIWRTTNPDSKGWDGLINGKRGENGNYVYKLIGMSFNGLNVERDGIFALLK